MIGLNLTKFTINLDLLVLLNMNTEEKKATYQTTNTYSTLNSLTDKTKNVWLVFHGIGYLSRYFIKHFETLNAEENYLIAPQAPSKYYKGNDYKKVGSSWLTRENTQSETKNVLNYIEAVIEAEQIPKYLNLIILGYSQGVSIASRLVAHKKIQCQTLFLVSGGFPKELTQENFDFLDKKTKIIYILGEQDPYINPEGLEIEKKRMLQIFADIQFVLHPGGHELDITPIKENL